MRSGKSAWGRPIAALVVAGGVLTNCTSAAIRSQPTTAIPSEAPIPAVAPTLDPLPALTLEPGEHYFRLNGNPAFIFSRNIAGVTKGGFEVLVEMARAAGDVVVRVGVDNQAMGGYRGYGYTSDGAIRDSWSQNWEHFLDVAEANGIYVLPYFTGWMNWNTSGFNTWADNPFNASQGGPAESPTELFREDSPTQLLYIKWFKSVVERWQPHRNILAWEVFTEVNYVNYVSQPQGVYLVEQLAAAAREADPLHRPTTASLADVGEWPDFYRSDAVEFINFHPYPPSAKLDAYVIHEVRRYITTYNKPLLIGESGLNAAEPNTDTGKLTVAPNARVGIQHAIWAELVSGAMNGRALFWEDGYGVYFPELGMPWLESYAAVEAPAARFIQDVDVAGYEPIEAQASAGIVGAALGDEHMVIGWYRDAGCEPPDWQTDRIVAGQTVKLRTPGSAVLWRVDFYSTQDGATILDSLQAISEAGMITISLPDFSDAIAFKLIPQ